MNVAVCIPTYRRPNGLRELLGALNGLIIDDDEVVLRIVIVDNDAAESGRAVCEEARRHSHWPIDYEVERRRGIAFARNRAVDLAASADFIAFIDDDEVPEPQWLAVLLEVQARHAADVVAGPVVPAFRGPVPRWVARGRFFDRRRLRTGAPIKHAGTGNVLIRVSALQRLGSLFNEKMALTGGEDTELFLRAHRAGLTMVWADAAVAHESVPASRIKAGWLLRRAYRGGNTFARCELSLAPAWKVAPIRSAKALARLVEGLVRLPLALLLGPVFFIRTLQLIAGSLGSLAGLVGRPYEEYRSVHGT